MDRENRKTDQFLGYVLGFKIAYFYGLLNALYDANATIVLSATLYLTVKLSGTLSRSEGTSYVQMKLALAHRRQSSQIIKDRRQRCCKLCLNIRARTRTRRHRD